MNTLAPQYDDNFFNELLAFHKANFGDARMEGTEEESTESGSEEESNTEGTDEGTESSTEESTENEGGETLPPEVLRKELTSARAEAANYRTRLREAEKALAEAKTPEQFEAVQKDLTAKIADLEKSLLRTTVASKFELPDEFAARLVGDTEEELTADAKRLQQFLAPAAPESLGGGLDPSGDDDTEDDPRKLARRSRRR